MTKIPSSIFRNFMAAVADNRDKDVKDLLAEHGNDLLSIKDADENTALHVAVLNRREYVAKILLDAGAVADVENEKKETPLALAAVRGFYTAVNDLLDAKADPNRALPDGNTLLLKAVLSSSSHSVKALLKHGADVLATNKLEQTALDIAQQVGDAEIIRIVEQATNARKETEARRAEEKKKMAYTAMRDIPIVKGLVMP